MAQGARGAWPPTQYRNRYEDRESGASAAARAVAHHALVGCLDLTRYSSKGLAGVAGEKNGADYRDDGLHNHCPPPIELTSFH